MLVITRRVGESVWIGDDVRATILRVRGNRVQIGIQARDGTRIVRTETLEREPRPAAEGNSTPAPSAPAAPIVTFPALLGGESAVVG